MNESMKKTLWFVFFETIKFVGLPSIIIGVVLAKTFAPSLMGVSILSISDHYAALLAKFTVSMIIILSVMLLATMVFSLSLARGTIRSMDKALADNDPEKALEAAHLAIAHRLIWPESWRFFTKDPLEMRAGTSERNIDAILGIIHVNLPRCINAHCARSFSNSTPINTLIKELFLMLEMKTPSEDVKALGFFSPSSPLHENCFFREAFEKILHLLVGSCGWKIACLNESKRRSEQHMQLLELPGAAEVFTKYPEELEEEKKKRKSEKEALERLIQSYMDIEASAKNAREIIQSPTHESIDAFLSQLHNMGHRLTMIEKNPE